MQIKRFEAKNMTTALRIIQDELGPDAVILSARSLRKGKGLLGSIKYAGVEVTAAIDPAHPAAHHRVSTGSGNGYADSAGRRGLVASHTKTPERAVSADRTTADTTSGRRSGYTKKSVSGTPQLKALSSLYQQLLAQEVDRGIASQLIEEIKSVPAAEELLAKGEMTPQLISILEDMGVSFEPIRLANGKPKVLTLIGPTGAGKTTTIAKLAADQAARQRRSVALITLDNYGIAAFEHLNTYAQVLGIPLKAALNGAELKQVIKKFKDKELILIDTPGINPKIRHELETLKNYFDCAGAVEFHLVVSAATKEKDLIASVENLVEFPVHRLLFTKIDESTSFGSILNILIRTRLPLSYFARGRQVPDDIAEASFQGLIDLILPTGVSQGNPAIVSPEPLRSEAANQHDAVMNTSAFVANRNSDLYHCPDCSWARKIKPINIIEFASAQEAETKNFLPCRSCNPDRFERRSSIDSRRENRMFSGHR